MTKLRKNFNLLWVFLFVLFLPTQLGKHFFLPFSFLSGVRSDYLAPTIYFTDILALLLLLNNYPIVKDVFISLLRQHRWLFMSFVLFVIVNIITALIPPLAIYRWLRVLEWIVVFVIFNRVRFPPVLVMAGLFGGILIQVALVVLQLVNQHSVGGILYWLGERPLNLSMPNIAKISLNGKELLRPYGTFSHPNSLAGFYLLIYVWILTKRNKYAGFPLSVLGPMLTALLVFFSFSKVAIGAFLLINTLYWGLIFTRRSSSTTGCYFCALPKIAIPILLSLVFLAAQSDPLTLQKRLLLAKNSLMVFLQSPWMGTGLGNYLRAQNQLSNRLFDYSQQPVHNIFLLLLTELGIIGIGLTVWVGKIIKPLLTKRPITSMGWILLPVFITGFFDHYWITLQQNWLLTAGIFGLTLSSKE